MLDTSYTNIFPLDHTKLLWVTQISDTGHTYHIVSDMTRTTYELWKDNKPTKYQSAIPADLNKYIK